MQKKMLPDEAAFFFDPVLSALAIPAILAG